MTQPYSSHPSTITVPATQQSLDDLDLEFAEGEQARKPVTEVPRLWWHNGLPVVDAETVATGWHIKAGIDPTIDETMEGMGVQRYLVQHKRPDKNGDNSPKPYWRLRFCSLIVIASRVQSTLELSRSTDERFGIAFGWGTARDDDGNAELKEDGEPRLLRVPAHQSQRLQHRLHAHCSPRAVPRAGCLRGLSQSAGQEWGCAVLPVLPAHGSWPNEDRWQSPKAGNDLPDPGPAPCNH